MPDAIPNLKASALSGATPEVANAGPRSRTPRSSSAHPGQAKGLHIVINAILDAPGASVTTSTRPDNLAATLSLRKTAGPVAVFDPQGLIRVEGIRWSPVRGCEDPTTPIVRASGLAAGAGFTKGGVTDGACWHGQTEMALRGLLHAAAIDDSGIDSLYRWGLEPASAIEAVRVVVEGSSYGTGVGASATKESFGVEAGASAFIAVLLEDITETARQIAAHQEGGRMEPPLSLVLDEIANLCAVPSLPSLMADGGGSGIFTLVVIQSLTQARERWGEQAAAAMWDAATLRLILGGSAHPRDLQDLSAVCGDRDEELRNWSRGPDGGRTWSTSTRRMPVLPPDVLRTLPFGTGVLLARTAPPIMMNLRPWTARPDAANVRESIAGSSRAAS